MPLERLFSGRPVDIREVQGRLEKTAADLGLPFGESDRIYNTRSAHELGLWAQSRNRGEAFHTAVFKAYFVKGVNIAKIPLLVELASSAGLPADEALQVLETGAFQSAVNEDWELSKTLQVTAVPTLIPNRNRIVGARSFEEMRSFLEDNGVKRRYT